MEKVFELLERQHPQFNTITPDALVSDALYQMCCENTDFLVVLQDGRFQGVISDHDIAAKVLFATDPLNQIMVREFMNRTLPVATSYNTLTYCVQLMEKFHARHVAIFDDFNFRGVLSMQDISTKHENHNPADAWDVREEYPWTC